MNQFHVDLGGAIRWIGDLHGQKTKEYFELLKQARRLWGDLQLDVEVAQYLVSLGNLVRACSCYSFEVRECHALFQLALTEVNRYQGERYFGRDAAEVQRTRTVKLLPKRALADDRLTSKL